MKFGPLEDTQTAEFLMFCN